MVRKTSNNKIPRVLEERLLLNEEHRQVLQAMEELSPRDTGYIFIPGAKGRDIPSVDTIAGETKLSAEKVRARMTEVKKFWHVPDNLPTGNGKLTEEEALVSALTNQHKLRWDPEIKDYRVPRVIMYSAEMGTGTDYARNTAFEGEKILRAGLGLDEMLNAYIIQGGAMPEIMSMFGKLKTERAALTGLNKTGKRYDPKELKELKNDIELAQKKPLSARQVKNLEKFVVNTIDSMEEAAESVAYELKPLVENIPEHVPIHVFYSYNDDFNMDEIGDLLIASMRLIHKKAKEAEEKLPGLEEDRSVYKSRMAQHTINFGVADCITNYLSRRKEVPTGKQLRDSIEELFTEGNEKTSKRLVKLKKRLTEQYIRETGGEETDFERAFDTAKRRYLVDAITSLDAVKDRRRVDEEQKSSLEDKLVIVRDKINELKQYQKAKKAEEIEGHAWFTKKIAITPTESKALKMIQKANYKELYTDILFPKLEELVGRKLSLKLHTDREISVYVPDPTSLLGRNDYPSSQLYGTIITSIPRTNRQRSNEPVLNSFIELQKKHESAVTSRVKLQKERPKKVKEFDKRHSTAFSDVLMTSWGAEGYRVMPKFVIAPTQIEGEYRAAEPEIVVYFKCPTRHDTAELGEMAKRGNRGTWPVKRVEKGGPTTGNAIQIYHPDGSQEWFAVDDQKYEKVAEEYGEKVSAIEAKIARAKTSKTRKKWKNKLQKLYEEARPELWNILLANDLHCGASNMTGRPNNVDYIRASQQIVLQTYGMDNIQVVAGTEFLHGMMKIGKYGYDSTMEGQLEDPSTLDVKLDLLRRGLQKNGVKPDEITKYLNTYTSEQMHSRATFRPDDQMEMFINIVKPVFDELLAKGTKKMFLGSGNHLQQSVKGIDEASLVAKFLNDYKLHRVTGKLQIIPAHGQAYSNHPISLPSNEGVRVNAVLAHKMQSGNTEISKLADQAMGHKERALIYLTADRHQPGIAMEKERYFVLDCGKQTTMDYVRNIGKTGSVRGAMVTSYSPDGDLIYSTRFFLDNVVDRIIGWNHRSGILETCTSIIKNGLIESYK